MNNMMDRLTLFLEGNPHYIGLFMTLIGISGMVAAIADANWLFGDVGGVTYNLEKIDGWVNMFGRKTARIIFGIISGFVILAGMAWFLFGNPE